MACNHVPIPGGGVAIVCTSDRPKRCTACGKRADRLCDWKVKGRRSGTCDKPMCRRCSTNPQEDREKDLCPEHADAYRRWRAARA